MTLEDFFCDREPLVQAELLAGARCCALVQSLAKMPEIVPDAKWRALCATVARDFDEAHSAVLAYTSTQHARVKSCM